MVSSSKGVEVMVRELDHSAVVPESPLPNPSNAGLP